MYLLVISGSQKKKEKKMDQSKEKIKELFGEEHEISDEEVIREQQGLRLRLQNAFGSDSESEESREVAHWEDTDISDIEEATDEIELDYSDINEEEEDIKLPIGRLQGKIQEVGTVQQAKELAQFQRQIAAQITKYKGKPITRIPVVITDSKGVPVPEEERVQDEIQVIRQAEKIIQERNIIDIVAGILPEKLHSEHQHPDQVKPRNKPRIQAAVPINVAPDRTNNAASPCRRKRRAEAKRAWYQKKRSSKKQNN